MTGNGSFDTFFYRGAPIGGEADTITDFTSGEDTMEFDAASFGFTSGGELDLSAFQLGISADDADDRFIYDQASGDLFFDAGGNGAGAQLLIAILGAGTAFAADDIFLYEPAKAAGAEALASADMILL
ncbi:hypothetical protein K3165_11990 [Qipengyuania sp. 1XM1-15A]|uniref:hypothetical protein n=1 Tax=Qipengyuania xiamenensis TaxID=2867237 RepID=UPI001C883C1E|nr:hypothetical protein [Qipengyuania xiamenensis]MBX7533646.1 hypothetical protein [Qipengyuania xiamenensis]